jgi:1-acyl-sn-glycerol-3-phosphate acyltransferase
MPLVRILRLLWRVSFFAVFTFLIVFRIWIGRVLFQENMHQAMSIRQKWARTLLDRVGVDLKVVGRAPTSSCIIVANHRSYLDPILMLCHLYAYPVAKAELANWPLIGKGAQLAGILYLKREHSGSRANTLKLMTQKLEEGFSIIIFPEGTTSDLQGCLPFKKGSFQVASRLNAAVVPVAIHYPDSADFWVGSESFLAHGFRRFQQKKINVTLFYGPELRHSDAEELRTQSKQWIENQLIESNT